MLKIERDKLLVAVILTLVISIDMIQTSMLGPILPHIPNIVPFFGVVFLGLRFLYIKQYSFTFLLLAPLLLIAGCHNYYKTGNLNALMYLLLIIFLYRVELESVLKLYVGISLFFVVLIILLSMMGVIPNLQFVQSRAAGVVVRNSFGFIYPTDFASQCSYFYMVISYFQKKVYFLRTLSGLALAGFVIYFCDARLNAGSILAATGIFLNFYYRKHIKLFLKPMNWEKMFVSIELYTNVSIKSHSHKLVNMSIFRAGLFCYGTVQSYSNEISTGKIRES